MNARMPIYAERTLAIILIIGAGLHAYGSTLAFEPGTPALVWSLASSAFAAFLGLLSIVRRRNGHDRAFALVLIFGQAAWIVAAIGYGMAIDNVADPRVLYHVIVTVLLMLFPARSLAG